MICSNQTDDQLILTFEDTGIGIKETDLANIFIPFYRGEDVQDIIKGFGVGLTLAQNIINEVNGEINVSSVYGKGTVFSVTIPCNVNRTCEVK